MTVLAAARRRPRTTSTSASGSWRRAYQAATLLSQVRGSVRRGADSTRRRCPLRRGRLVQTRRAQPVRLPRATPIRDRGAPAGSDTAITGVVDDRRSTTGLTGQDKVLALCEALDATHLHQRHRGRRALLREDRSRTAGSSCSSSGRCRSSMRSSVRPIVPWLSHHRRPDVQLTRTPSRSGCARATN